MGLLSGTLGNNSQSISIQLPPGDFLKRPRFVKNMVYIDQQKEKLMNACVLREFRSSLASRKKNQIEADK